ncbi:hypothetical protein Ancab_012534 [Ancistrocladus abbreviatus]
MGNTSKDLLHLEHMDPSSSKDFPLLVCKDSKSCQEKPKIDGGSLTSPVPRSQVLGKVKDFLGIISEANKSLQVNAKDKPKDYDIEVLTGNESEYIEMDLMLGIADLRTPDAVAAAEAAIAGNQQVMNLPTCSSESESSSEDDDDDDDDDEDSAGEDENSKAGSLASDQNSKLQQGDSLGDVGSQQKKKRSKIVELS